MKTFLVMILATLSAAVGETLLSYIMRKIEQPQWAEPAKILGWLLKVITNPQVMLGIGFLVIFFFLYLAALSWADLSFVLPLTALSFVFAAVLARVVLKEDVSWWRWAGTIVILIGITLVSFDHRRQATGHSMEEKGLKTERRG